MPARADSSRGGRPFTGGCRDDGSRRQADARRRGADAARRCGRGSMGRPRPPTPPGPALRAGLARRSSRVPGGSYAPRRRRPTGGSRRSLRLVVVLAGLLQLPGLFAGPAHHQRRLPLRLGRPGAARRDLAVPLRTIGRPSGPATGPTPLSWAPAGPEVGRRDPQEVAHRQASAAAAGHAGHPLADEPRPGDDHLPARSPRPGSRQSRSSRHGRGARMVSRSDAPCWPSGSPTLLGRWFSRRDEDPRRALLWGWCPTVVIEASIGAHADVLAAVLLGERSSS